MCGRFVLIPNDLKNRFNVQNDFAVIKPTYNASPTQHLPVVTKNDGNTFIELMEWGLVPYWSKEKKSSYSMINARLETLLEKPTFKHAFAHHRCIIPASGFYEWQKTVTGKIPYFIFLPNKEIMGLAGIYELWTDSKTGLVTKSYCIITTESVGIMENIHNRTPVIIKKELENEWLTRTDLNSLYNILKQNHTELEMYQVSIQVNSPTNNDKTLIEPI